MVQQTAVVKNSGIRTGGFKSQFNHLLDLQSWARYQTSIKQMQNINTFLAYNPFVKNKGGQD